MCAQVTSVDANSSWAAYEPNNDAPWDIRRVVHLHRRAGFGAPWDVLQRDLQAGPRAAVDRLLHGHTPDEQRSKEFEQMSRTIGDAAMASGSPGRLKAWWIYRMLFSPDPLGERLTLMWHNHFATSNRKVQDLVRMRQQNELLRKHCRAPFPELLAAVIKHPALLMWLDADSNRKGQPNENLARELMELFTLGIGNFTEADVKEAARALTGWTIIGKEFGVQKKRHDSGEKTVLGQTAPLDGDDLLELLIGQPATSYRLAWRICQTFMGEDVVDEQALSQLAEAIARNGLDIGWGVETVLRSQLFFSPRNLRSRVIGPIQYIVGSLRAMELCHPPPSTLLLAEWSARMGEDLFYPPNVGGWSLGRAWLGTRTVIARGNFAHALAAGKLWNPTMESDFEKLLQIHEVDSSLEAVAAWLTTLLWGEAPIEVIEPIVSHIQLKRPMRPFANLISQLLARPENQLG